MGAAGGAVMLGAVITPPDTDQLPKSAVEYQPAPLGYEDCSKCLLFAPPDACSSVAGFISPRGWCELYVAKKAERWKDQCQEDSISPCPIPARLRNVAHGAVQVRSSRKGIATDSIAAGRATFVRTI